MKKTNLLRSLMIVSLVLIGLGIYLGIVGAEILNIPFIRMDLVPFAVGFCGVLMFVMILPVLYYEKHKTVEQKIEENDERNQTIEHISKSKAFNVLATLFPFSLLGLAVFGYMNKVSFFLLAGVYLLSFYYYLLTRMNYATKM